MSFTRQLSEMSASELNEAIDDSNFPQAHILSRGRNNSICSTGSASGNSSLLDRNLSQTDDASAGSVAGNVANEAQSDGAVSKAITNRPKLVIKANGTIPENDSIRTPMTPRTSTTPGITLHFFNL